MSEARLHVSDSQGRRVVVLDRPLFLIGRRTAADLQIVSTDVSREHAEIVQEDGRYTLRDRGSRYGTFVNGEQITERALQHGDRIRLGRTDAIELIFATDAAKTTGFLDASSSEGTNLKQMAAIFDGLRALGSGRMLDEVLTVVMDSALEVTKAERGFMMLANLEGELEMKIARGRGKATLPGTTFQTSEKIPRDVFKTGMSQTVNDLMDINIAQQHDRTIAVGIRHVLCVPLRVTPMSEAGSGARAQRVIGVLYLDGRERGTISSEATKNSLEAFATQAAIAIESARLYAQAAEKARIDRDLRVAAEIQRSLLAPPSYGGATCELAAVSIPCRTIGGDFYDYLETDQDHFAFALGDVAGKGPPAALLAAALQANLVAYASLGGNAARTVASINGALLRRPIEARFATMFFGVLTPRSELTYCSAGHEPPFVLTADGVRSLDEGGAVLGLFGHACYTSETVQLSPGDLIVVCSDGVTEATNLDGLEFGRARVLDAVSSAPEPKAEAILDHLVGAVREFSQGMPQADDITVMVIRVGPASVSE